MTQPGRKLAQGNSGYKYGFNGKEKSSEISLEECDFGARIYDGRLGRWLSVDPLQLKYTDYPLINFVQIPLFPQKTPMED